MRKSWIGYAAVLAVVGGVAVASTAGAHTRSAKTTLRDTSGQEIGVVKFVDARGATEVRVEIRRESGVAVDAFHGFHIHANDVATNGEGCIADPAADHLTWFVSADGHWKTGTQTHGQHAGDMPSVFVNANGSVETRFTISRIALSELAGKAVVLHAGADNFGNVPVGTAADQYAANAADATTKTQNTGNAGDRIACGVIAGR